MKRLKIDMKPIRKQLKKSDKELLKEINKIHDKLTRERLVNGYNLIPLNPNDPTQMGLAQKIVEKGYGTIVSYPKK